MKFNSTSKSKTNHRKMYFKRRNAHLFKPKFNHSKLHFTEHSNFIPNYKLPILTSIEIINSSSNKSSNVFSSSIDSILFNDYILVSANIKFKYLLCTLFDQVVLENKENYLIVDGYVKLGDWEPISLNKICSINQSLDKLCNKKSKLVAQSSKLDPNDAESLSVFDVFKTVISLISINIKIKTKKNGDSNNTNLECIETCAKNQIHKKLQDLKNTVDDDDDNDDDDDDNNENFEQSDDYQGSNESNLTKITNEEELHQLNEVDDQDDNESASESNGQNFSNFGLNSKIANMSPNLTALLYTNPHLANLFSMFNFPILSQYLNGFKKPDNQTDLSNVIHKQNQHSKNSSSNLSVETRLVNSINESNKSNNHASPSSSYSSASSTSSVYSFRPNECQTMTKSANSDDNLSFQNIQLEQLQRQFQQDISSNQNFSKEKKQRERTTFDPHEEISRLMQIFEQTHHPSRYQIASICDSLNSLACRKDKKPLEPYNIQYWFKNARAALRRKSKSENSSQSKNGIQHDLGSNEDSKNSFDDFDEVNLDKVESYFLNQKGVKHEKSDQNVNKLNYDYQNDDVGTKNLDINSDRVTQLNKNPSNNSLGVQKTNGGRRNRVFIDPISEVPILEHYFSIETYPDHYLIEKICDILNKGEYRYKFPKLEARNIQLWFKNHRAKLKRLKTAASESNIADMSNRSKPKLNISSGKEEVDNSEIFDDYDYGDYESEDNAQNSQAISN